MITKNSRKRKMVEVFKTNVEQTEQSQWLIDQIICHIPDGMVNFDLEGCNLIQERPQDHKRGIVPIIY